jgi:hypothetical protein
MTVVPHNHHMPAIMISRYSVQNRDWVHRVVQRHAVKVKRMAKGTKEHHTGLLEVAIEQIEADGERPDWLPPFFDR